METKRGDQRGRDHYGVVIQGKGNRLQADVFDALWYWPTVPRTATLPHTQLPASCILTPTSTNGVFEGEARKV